MKRKQVHWLGGRVLLPLALVGVLLGAALADLSASSNKPVHLTVLFATDLYGKLRDFRCKRPGVKDSHVEKARMDIANLLYQVGRLRRELVQRRQLPPPLVFNTGDNLATALTARFLLEFEGLAGVDFIADVFQRFGFDVIGLGNHEFSVPPEKLSDFLMQARLKHLRFSVANLDKAPANHALSKYVNKDSTGQNTPYFIFRRGGLKIGVFHLVPYEMEKRVSARAVKGVQFGDPSGKASELVPKLRDELGVDLVIVLSHLEGSRTNGAKVRALAQQTPGIDLIITNELRGQGGTTQAISAFSPSGRGVFIAGSAKYGTQLGRIDLQVVKPPGGKARIAAFQPSAIPLEESKYNKELRRDLMKWELSYCKRWGKPIGEGRIRAKEGMTHKQFMDYLLNLIREKTHTEVAFINVKAIKKAPFPFKGYLTKDDLYRALPFNEKIEVITLNGSEISALLEQYWDLNKPNSPKALHFVGVEMGSMGTAINGRTINPSGTYSLATIRFIASGREGWLTLKKEQRRLLRYKDGSVPKIRSMIIDHFEGNRYRQLPQSSPPKPQPPIDPNTGMPKKGVKLPKPKPFAPNEIPYNGKFVDLSERVAWKFDSRLEGGFTSIFIEPINIGSFYNQKDTLSGGFYQKYQFNTALELKLQADTRMHLWISQFSIRYDADSSSTWSTIAPQGPRDPVYTESTDQIQLKSEYHLRYFDALFPGQRKWYFTSPFLEGRLETELFPGNRGPGTTAEDNFKAGNPEYFRHFEIIAKAGLSFKIIESLGLKFGFAWRKEFALNYQRQNPKLTQQSVNTDNNIGFSAEYNLQQVQIVKIGESPLYWESRAEYLFTVLVAPNKPGLIVHDLIFENKLSFSIVGNFRLSLGAKFYLYRGIFRRNPLNPAGSFEEGPISFRIDPNVSLSFNWATRSQWY